MKEVWKDIPGYKGIAKASSLGRIKVHVYPRGTEIENISELEGVSYEIIH